MGDAPDTEERAARRRALLEELHALERDHLRVRAGLAALGPGARLPGLHVVARAAGRRLLVPGARIAEVARLVACDPVPGSERWLLGGFVWRGQPALAVDLGLRLGGRPAASLDAVMVILDGAPPVALVVEALGDLTEDLLVSEIGPGAGEGAGPWIGTCRLGEEALPVLAPEVVEREVRGATAPGAVEVSA